MTEARDTLAAFLAQLRRVEARATGATAHGPRGVAAGALALVNEMLGEGEVACR